MLSFNLKKETIDLWHKVWPDPGAFVRASAQDLKAFEALVRADEREQIEDEWSMCIQSDLEHGVKSLNETAAKEFHKNYPEIVKFWGWLNARGEHMTDKEALKLALEAQQIIASLCADKVIDSKEENILRAAINQALAAPVQEKKAYAWVYVNKYGVDSMPESKEWCEAMVSGHGGSMFALYTTPPAAQCKPLTNEQIGHGPIFKKLTIFRAGVRFAEAAHGIAAQRKPMTNEQIGQDPVFVAGVRFAEAAHGIKENT
jgi:hypothetical protein